MKLADGTEIADRAELERLVDGGANLRGANLSGADLHGAVLCGATIDGAIVSETHIGGPGHILYALTDAEAAMIKQSREKPGGEVGDGQD